MWPLNPTFYILILKGEEKRRNIGGKGLIATILGCAHDSVYKDMCSFQTN
jgi:hypothetical protein